MSYEEEKSLSLKKSTSEEGSIASSISSEESYLYTFSTETEFREITPLLSQVCAMILDNTSDEIDVLKSCHYRQTCTGQEDTIAYIPPELRFGFSDEVIYGENMKIKLSSTVSEFSRLVQILMLVRAVMKVGVADLLQNRTFQTLKQAVTNIRLMRSDETSIISTYKEIYKLHYKLIEDIITEHLELSDYIKRAEDNIIQAKDDFEATLQEQGIKYFTQLAWEASRKEQNFHINSMKEDVLLKMIKQKQNDTADEKIVHYKLIKFFEEHIEDLKEDIRKWMIKYEEDLDATDINIAKMRIEVDNQQKKVEDLQDAIDSRKEEMRNWMRYKIRQKLMQKKIIFKMRAATVIQHWWRDIVYRRSMGKKLKKKRKAKSKQSSKLRPKKKKK